MSPTRNDRPKNSLPLPWRERDGVRGDRHDKSAGHFSDGSEIRPCFPAFAAALVLSSLAAGTGWGQQPGQPAEDAPSEGTAWAGITSLEQFLSRTLATHPEVVAAEANVASAEAELRRTRFQIARELITFWNDWKTTEGHVARLMELDDAAAISVEEVVEAKAKLAKMEGQLPYLLGTATGTPQGGPGALRAMGPKRLPQGPEVEKLRAVLDEPAELEFIETPLEDVVDTLEDLHGIQMTTDPEAAELPVTATSKGVPLGAALQMVEDTTPGVRFVVTDYGLLATTDTSEHAMTYISANEFWREQTGTQEPSAPRRPPRAKGDRAKEAPPGRTPPSPPSLGSDPFAPGGAKRPAAGDPFGP